MSIGSRRPPPMRFPREPVPMREIDLDDWLNAPPPKPKTKYSVPLRSLGKAMLCGIIVGLAWYGLDSLAFAVFGLGPYPKDYVLVAIAATSGAWVVQN